MTHLASCSTLTRRPWSLTRFESLLRSSIQCITNSDLSGIWWLQASLPVKDGSLGVRHVSSLALPAFLASAASTLSLQADILADCACSDISPTGHQPLALFQTIYLQNNHSGIVPAFWQVKSIFCTPTQLASFLAASSQHRRLASGNANIVMWVEAWWWSSENRSRSAAWLDSPCHTNATVEPWLMGRDCTALFARRLRVDQPALNDLVAGAWSLLA